MRGVASILVVDDDRDSCEALARFLTKSGHTVRCVGDGREAMAALSAGVPDFILVDIRMPVMDGVSLVHVIRSYLRWRNIPIAVVTAYPEDPRLTHLAELGVRRVFRKSEFTFDEVSEWMSHAAAPPPESPDPPPPSLRD
jgi:CheY-like chemotaxis protein